MTEQAPASSVQHLGFAWFAMVMGLCGLSLAWARAVPHWGSVALQVSLGVGVLAAGVLSLLLLGQLWRLLRYPAALLADARHPLRHVFVAALPSSLVLLPTVWVAHQGYSLWADVMWMLGAVGLVLATLGVVGRWLQPGLAGQDFWPGITPALFIPVVGNVLPALAGVSLGHPVWAAAQYGLAAVLWPVALALVWVRIGMVGLWPQRLLPTTFIMIAPPSVLALSGHALGAPALVVHMLAGVALFFSLLSFTVLRRCLQQAFGMPFWALSFPLAASAALGLHLSPEPGLTQWLASVWLWVVTGVIGALLLATLRGLMRGQLLQPEGPALLPKRVQNLSSPLAADTMELRQLRYFVRVVELGSISRAALDLNLVQSALSQQITRLEGELSTRLLQRSPQGVTPTEAGVAFFREAQLTLRHAEQAIRVAQQARLSGTVSVGLAPTTAAVLGLPLMQAMRERYPDVRLHMVESLSGHLSSMLNARQLDLAVLFDLPMGTSPSVQAARRWSVLPLIEEDIFLISARHAIKPGVPTALRMAQLKDQPLILPTGPHGLRSTLDAAFLRAKLKPLVALEVDSLAMLMDAVQAGMGATLQPWAAVARQANTALSLHMARITDHQVKRSNWLCGLSEDELSPAALAARVVLADCVRLLVGSGAWQGAALSPQA